jgi:hypothetical protein
VGGAIASAAAIDDDGQVAVLGASDAALTLWDGVQQKQIGAAPPTGEATDFPRDPYEARISTGVHVTETGLVTFNGPRPALSRGSREAGTVVQIGRWPIDPELWRATACDIAGRPLNEEEWRDLFGDVAYSPACPATTRS